MTPKEHVVVVVGEASAAWPEAALEGAFDTARAVRATAGDIADADCVVAAGDRVLDAVDAALEADTPVIAILDGDRDAARLLDAGVEDVVSADADDRDDLLHARVRAAIDHADAERRVAAERTRFDALFGQFPEPTVAYEFRGGDPVVTAANDAFRETFGYADAHLTGRHVDDLVVAETDRDEADALNERVRRGDTLDREVTRQTPHGDRVFWLRNIPLDTAPPAGFAVYTDVTDRLRERERAQTYLEHSRDIVAIITDDLTYGYVSPAVEHAFGYSPGERIGRHALANVHPDDRERICDALDALPETEPVTVEFRGSDADGDWRWIEAVVTDQRDNPLIDGYLVNARDVTERKARERDRRRQARIITTLHEVAVDIQTAESPQAVYQSLVDAAEDVLDYQLCIVDRRDGDRLVPAAVPDGTPDDHYFDYVPIDEEHNLAAEVARTGETIVVDDLAAAGAKPAESSYHSAITVPLDDYGIFQAVADEVDAFDDADREFTEVLASHAVATLDRLAHERDLEHQTDRLEKFASVVSHDLRTPLQVALGSIALARETDDPARLDTAEDALRQIDRLVTDLLAWARGAALVDDTEPVNIAAAATSCWETLDTDRATLHTREAVVDADPDRLRQLLENLLRNAVEHGASSSDDDDDAHVTVTVAPTEDGAGFYVADDGPGVPPEKRDTVFDAGYTTSDSGTGFGLDIARDIAAAHGWTLTLDESESGGARFTVDCTTGTTQ